ncbi:MAG: hypothetical protein M3470_05730 [Chloroflexota bacterium]|nr:hypothetical protein [Chloroflexota bacterium]
MSVIGGWIASVGAAALLSPLIGGIVTSRGGTADDISLAVPAVLGVLVTYLVGGYVAGRMAGHSTSWHGMMTAFFGLFVILAVILTGLAADRGYLGDLRIGLPAGTFTVGDAVTFGAILGFLAAIFAGWLGGLLAPTRTVASAPVAPVDRTVPVTTVEDRTVVREPEPVAPRKGFRLLPDAGRKRDAPVERTERVDADRDGESHDERGPDRR